MESHNRKSDQKKKERKKAKAKTKSILLVQKDKTLCPAKNYDSVLHLYTIKTEVIFSRPTEFLLQGDCIM